MNKETKKTLELVINSLVNEDSKGATNAFHDYLRAKTQSILLSEMKSCENEEESDEDEDDKKPAFLKKKSKKG